MNDFAPRIGVDISTLRPPFTGIANYEIQLLRRLMARLPTAEFKGYGIYQWKTVDAAFLAQCAPTQMAPSGARRSALRYNTFVHSMRNQVRKTFFSATIEKQGIDLYHAFSYRPPGKVDAPVIPVVYDLSTVRHPETHPRARLKWMEPLEALCRQAPFVHTISQFTAEEIETLFSIPRERIIIAPPGINPLFLEANDVDLSTPDRFDLTAGSFLLTVSTIEPRKNLKTLLKAYGALARPIRQSMPLVVVGAQGWGQADLPDNLNALEQEGSVRFAGYVSDEELRSLYTAARAMFYPSIYEGFGMPITEAMACGTTVIASRSSSMPEAGGPLARYVDALDVDRWRQEMEYVFGSQDHLDLEARKARSAHAHSFSWDSSASIIEAMYRRTLV